MRIWKFSLIVADLQLVPVPLGSRLLTVQVQAGPPQLWAICDENAPPALRSIAMYGTGHPMPEDVGSYLGTFQLEGGALVFHAFEIHQRLTAASFVAAPAVLAS